MPDDGAPPRKHLAVRSKKRKKEQYAPVKLEPIEYQVRRTNPWRLSGFGSHDTIQWLPRPYLPWP